MYGILGPSFDVKISETIEGVSFTSDAFKGLDIGAVFGAGVEAGRLIFGGRYSRGLRKVNKNFSEASFVDPLSFRPERWLPGTPGAHEPSVQMPFGSGPRLRPGRSLALLEMKLVLAPRYKSFVMTRVGTSASVRERFTFTMNPVGQNWGEAPVVPAGESCRKGGADFRGLNTRWEAAGDRRPLGWVRYLRIPPRSG